MNIKEETKQNLRISPITGKPVRMYRRRISTGWGGRRVGAGRKPMESDWDKKVGACFSVSRNCKYRLQTMAMEYDMSVSQWLDTVVEEEWAKREKKMKGR